MDLYVDLTSRYSDGLVQNGVVYRHICLTEPVTFKIEGDRTACFAPSQGSGVVWIDRGARFPAQTEIVLEQKIFDGILRDNHPLRVLDRFFACSEGFIFENSYEFGTDSVSETRSSGAIIEQLRAGVIAKDIREKITHGGLLLVQVGWFPPGDGNKYEKSYHLWKFSDGRTLAEKYPKAMI